MSGLIGRKSDWDSLKSWLQAWNSGAKPDPYPFIIVGESGWGKSTVAHHISEQVGMEPTPSDGGFRDSDSLKKWFGQVRSRSFTNQMRAGILDDASFLSGAEWKMVGEQVKLVAFPLVICVQTEADVPWQIRRSAMMLKLSKPSRENLLQYLDSIDSDRSDNFEIAKIGASFRNAELIQKTTPEGFVTEYPDEFEPRIPTRHKFAEVQAILSGEFPGNDFTSHPLSILQTANHNHTRPEFVGIGSVLHGLSWRTDQLEPIARGFLLSLRSNSTDRPPFRKKLMKQDIERPKH